MTVVYALKSNYKNGKYVYDRIIGCQKIMKTLFITIIWCILLFLCHTRLNISTFFTFSIIFTGTLTFWSRWLWFCFKKKKYCMLILHNVTIICGIKRIMHTNTGLNLSLCCNLNLIIMLRTRGRKQWWMRTRNIWWWQICNNRSWLLSKQYLFCYIYILYWFT